MNDVARILLQAGRGFTQVDRDIEQLVLMRKWWIRPSGNTAYAYTSFRRDGRLVSLPLHRLVLGLVPGDGLVVDHRNGDGLDNRRANLRIATRTENSRNARRRPSASRYRGVDRVGSRYRAKIMAGRVVHVLGHFPTAELAARAYNEAAQRLHGEFAVLNRGLA